MIGQKVVFITTEAKTAQVNQLTGVLIGYVASPGKDNTEEEIEDENVRRENYLHTRSTQQLSDLAGAEAVLDENEKRNDYAYDDNDEAEDNDDLLIAREAFLSQNNEKEEKEAEGDCNPALFPLADLDMATLGISPAYILVKIDIDASDALRKERMARFNHTFVTGRFGDRELVAEDCVVALKLQKPSPSQRRLSTNLENGTYSRSFHVSNWHQREPSHENDMPRKMQSYAIRLGYGAYALAFYKLGSGQFKTNVSMQGSTCPKTQAIATLFSGSTEHPVQYTSVSRPQDPEQYFMFGFDSSYYMSLKPNLHVAARELTLMKALLAAPLELQRTNIFFYNAPQQFTLDWIIDATRQQEEAKEREIELGMIAAAETASRKPQSRTKMTEEVRLYAIGLLPDQVVTNVVVVGPSWLATTLEKELETAFVLKFGGIPSLYGVLAEMLEPHRKGLLEFFRETIFLHLNSSFDCKFRLLRALLVDFLNHEFSFLLDRVVVETMVMAKSSFVDKNAVFSGKVSFVKQMSLLCPQRFRARRIKGELDQRYVDLPTLQTNFLTNATIFEPHTNLFVIKDITTDLLNDFPIVEEPEKRLKRK